MASRSGLKRLANSPTAQSSASIVLPSSCFPQEEYFPRASRSRNPVTAMGSSVVMVTSRFACLEQRNEEYLARISRCLSLRRLGDLDPLQTEGAQCAAGRV